MEYIRSMKGTDTWDPNQSHCVYGLDADLILLGLVTHEPNFAILREDVRFSSCTKLTSQVLSKEARKAKKNDRALFQLLHLSLVREYINLDFCRIKLPFEFNLEHVLDDFVLLMTFVGNDFLPNLPSIEYLFTFSLFNTLKHNRWRVE